MSQAPGIEHGRVVQRNTLLAEEVADALEDVFSIFEIPIEVYATGVYEGGHLSFGGVNAYYGMKLVLALRELAERQGRVIPGVVLRSIV